VIVTTKNIPLSKILRQVIREEKVVEDKEYPVLGIHWYAKGLYIKYVKKGHEIKAKKLYVVRKGDFVYSRLFAWKGSFALVPVELDGCYVSDEFPCFEVDESKINPRYLMYFFTNEKLWEQSLELSEGSTGISRNRLKVDKFLSFEIPLPSLEIQNKVVEKLDLTVNLLKRLDDLKEEFNNDLFALKNQILHEAVQGKLVEQDPRDEPAAVLLKRIREEKERLIKENKIKKEKPLPPISPEEIPYELPKGWEWVRFGDITINRDSERVPLSREEREKRKGIYDYYGASGVIDKIDGYLFDKTLLLIGEDGANLINRSTPIAFLAEGKYWVNNHAHVIDAIDITILKYLCIYINSINLEPYITGTAQPKMNQAKLNSIVVALPPLKEQIRIISRVEKLLELCNKLEKRVNSSKSDLQILLQSLLRETFSYL